MDILNQIESIIKEMKKDNERVQLKLKELEIKDKMEWPKNISPRRVTKLENLEPNENHLCCASFNFNSNDSFEFEIPKNEKIDGVCNFKFFNKDKVRCYPKVYLIIGCKRIDAKNLDFFYSGMPLLTGAMYKLKVKIGAEFNSEKTPLDLYSRGTSISFDYINFDEEIRKGIKKVQECKTPNNVLRIENGVVRIKYTTGDNVCTL